MGKSITKKETKKVVQFYSQNRHLTPDEIAEHFEITKNRFHNILQKARTSNMPVPIAKAVRPELRTRRNLLLKYRIEYPEMNMREIADASGIPLVTVSADFEQFRKDKHPFFITGKLSQADRLDKIEEACKIHQEISAIELAEMFNVKPCTISNDIRKIQIRNGTLKDAATHALGQALQIKQIVEVFKENPRLSRNAIAEKTKIPAGTVKRLLKLLADEIKERELTDFYLRREIEDAEYQKDIDELQKAWENTSDGARGKPRYKELILKARADRARMLGLDAPIKVDVAVRGLMSKEQRDKFIEDAENRRSIERPALEEPIDITPEIASNE